MGQVSEVKVSEAEDRVCVCGLGRGCVHVLKDWETWPQTSMLYLH